MAMQTVQNQTGPQKIQGLVWTRTVHSTLRPPCPYPNRSQRIYPTISHLDWLILHGVLATLSAICFSLLKTFAFPNIYVNLVLH